MTLDDLYSIADKSQISVHHTTLSDCASVSMRGHIAFDENKFTSYAEEKTCLAHELGHCITGSFYTVFSKFDIKSKHGHRADKWSILTLIPSEEYFKLTRSDNPPEIWELAEHFGVTEDLIKKAVYYYENQALSAI